jgi:hypothetical protein
VVREGKAWHSGGRLRRVGPVCGGLSGRNGRYCNKPPCVIAECLIECVPARGMNGLDRPLMRRVGGQVSEAGVVQQIQYSPALRIGQHPRQVGLGGPAWASVRDRDRRFPQWRTTRSWQRRPLRSQPVAGGVRETALVERRRCSVPSGPQPLRKSLTFDDSLGPGAMARRAGLVLLQQNQFWREHIGFHGFRAARAWSVSAR